MPWVPPYGTATNLNPESIMYGLSDRAILGKSYADEDYDWVYMQYMAEDWTDIFGREHEGMTLLEAAKAFQKWDPDGPQWGLVEALLGDLDRVIDGPLELMDYEWWFLTLVMFTSVKNMGRFGPFMLRLLGWSWKTYTWPRKYGHIGPLNPHYNALLAGQVQKLVDRTSDATSLKTISSLASKWVDKIKDAKRIKPWEPAKSAVINTADVVSKLTRSLSWQGRVYRMGQADISIPDHDYDWNEMYEEVVDLLRGDRYLGSHETEEMEGNMPYNRRTGQWYPARRRGGYGYRRGYRRYGSGTGYGQYNRRRRTYRRW